MTDGKEPKMSAVAVMENWKVAVHKEMAVAGQFEENWGFLKAKPEETKVDVWKLKPNVTDIFTM
jgi:hypothetical protein